MNRQASFCQGTGPIQFTLKTLLLLFVIFWLSLAAFGVWGIPITVVCVAVGAWYRYKKASFAALIQFMVFFILIGGLCIFLLLPCACAINEISRRATCMNSTKNIAYALLNYENDQGCFPQVCSFDKTGQLSHSWRTQLLPYIEENNLYFAYDFDQPWNSPHNAKLADKSNINLLRCPSCRNWQKPITNYLAVTGPGTIWDGDKKVCVEDIIDGPANTILLVEISDSNRNWMEPRDITLEEALGKFNNGITTVPSSNHCTRASYFFKSLPLAGHVVMADGSIRFLPTRLEPDDLAALLSIDGGESVDIEQLLIAPEHPLYKRLRWDHVIGLPLFLIAVVWFWYRLLDKPVNSAS